MNIFFRVLERRALRNLNSESISRKKRAINNLGKIKSEKAIEPLIGLLDKSIELSLTPWYSLGSIGEKSVEPLMKEIQKNDEKTLSWALCALGYTRSEKAIQPLVQAYDNENSDIRFYAISGLDDLIKPMPMKSPNIFDWLVFFVVGYYVEKRPEFVNDPINEKILQQTLEKAVKDENFEVRIEALRAFRHLRIELGEESFVNALFDPHPHVRGSAVLALENYGTHHALPYLKEILQDYEMPIYGYRSIATISRDAIKKIEKRN